MGEFLVSFFDVTNRLVMRIFCFLFFSSDPSIEFYPKKYCDIVKDVTQPTCLETSILELWATDGNFTNQKTKDKIASATKQDILDIINTKKFSEIFLFDKDFTALLGGITKNATNHIIGQVHEMFSRIFRVRIYDFFLQNIILIY